MRRGWWSMALLLCACTDYAVHVDFDIPAAYRDDVATVSLAIVVPPPAAPFGCDELAFGEVPAATVELATIQTVTGAQPLAGIPRTGAKLFYARGLDAQDLPLVAGCAELGDVDGVVDLTIPGEPTAVLDLQDKDPGNPLPAAVEVLVVDARGEPLIGAEVRFTVSGPADGTTSGTATTDDRGRVDLAPTVPTLPGPHALDVRVRWNRLTPDSVLGFTTPPTLYSTVMPGDADDLVSASVEGLYVVGRIGPAGEPGFAGLGKVDDIDGGRQVLLAWYDADLEPPFATVTSPVINGALTLGLISAPGEDRQRVFTITGTQWIELDPAGTLDASLAPDPGRPASRILPADDCENGDGDRVLVAYTDDSLAIYDSTGASVASPIDDMVPEDARVAASGCVSSAGDAALHRTAIYSTGTAQLLIRSDLDGGRHGNLVALAQGVGFAPPLAGEAHLLASEVDVDGVRMGRWRLAPLGAEMLELEKVTDDGSTAPPLSTQGGDVDGDGEVDVVALLGLGERDAATLFRVRVTLEVDHAGGRLTGLSEASTLSRPRMFLHDFDGDGVDDVLIAAPEQAIVLRMGPD